MICNDYDGLFEVSDSHYIDDMMEFMDFPGSHFVQVPDESKTKWGFVIIGLVIGIAGLIPGMIIGAALGYLIGCACKGKENQSVSNTMSFVQTIVLPRLSVGFQDMQSNSVKRFRQQAQLEIEQCTSGLETFMSDGKDIVNQLRSFNISEN